MNFYTKNLLTLICSVVLLPALSVSVQAQFQSPTEFGSPEEIPTNFTSATYDSATGEVYLVLANSSQVLAITGATFLTENFISSTPLGPAQQLDPDGIGFLALSPFPDAGPFSIGNILPADPSIRTAEQLAEVYPLLAIQFDANSSVPITAGFNVIPAAVPEPGSLASLSMILMAACLRRRR